MCETFLTEAKLMSAALPIITGTSPEIPSAENLVFNNFEPLTDGTLVAAKPDLYDGTRPEQIHAYIRESLGSVILPSTTKNAPALPNFFLEAKGPDGLAGVAKRQACYNGALGARTMSRIQEFGEGRDESNAVTITSTFHDGNLKVYTVHLDSSTSPEGPIYYMTQLRSFAMTDQLETFLEGVCYFRNAREWAVELRDQVVAAANLKLQNVDISRTSASDTHLDESDTSVGTLSLHTAAAEPMDAQLMDK